MGFKIGDILLAAAAVGAVVATGGAAAAPAAGAAAGTAATAGTAAATGAVAGAATAGATAAGAAGATAGTAAAAGTTAASTAAAGAGAGAAGTAATGGTIAGTAAGAGASKAALIGKIGTGITSAAGLGQAYTSAETARLNQKRAEMQQQISVKQQLRAARIARANVEAAGAASGTTGSSSEAGAFGSIASNLGSNLGLLNVNKRMDAAQSRSNMYKTGFGLLSVGGQYLTENKEFLNQSLFQKA